MPQMEQRFDGRVMNTPSAHCQARLPILLRQLQFPTVAANYGRLALEAAIGSQPCEEYLLGLLEKEVAQRDINHR